jgi:ferredoxin
MLISNSNLKTLIEGLVKSGQTVIAPVRDGVESSYQPVKSFDEVNLSLPYPVKSTKEYFLADSERILAFSSGQKGTELTDAAEPAGVILFGIRPCEAASYPIMDKVFTWDYNDEFYLKRREKSIIITVACETADEFCFCTSVGITLQTTEGSDIFLHKTKSGNYSVNAVSPKGEQLVNQYKSLFNESGNESPVECKEPAKKFDIALIKPWLAGNFEHPMWSKVTLPCIGCGICTYLCPTCHCFDIVDEGTLKGGCRYKNWDACQFTMFTVHASGHNPRDNQSKRFRQRVQHKFNYYPDKFGRTLCVGCGRCIRHCPADMSLLNVLGAIDKLAKT